MAKTIQSTNYDILITDLLHELTIKADEADRCNEMLARLAQYKPTDKIPVEVVDFIGNYSTIQIVGKEGLIMDGIGLIRKALEGVIKAILWILEKLKEIFKFLFNSQYRACKETLELQRRVIVLSTNADAVTRFESTNCTVVQKKDVDDLIFKTQSLTQLIKNCSKMDSKEYVDQLLKTFSADCGVALDPDNKLTDSTPNPSPLHGTTFGGAGWTVNGLSMTINNYLGTIRGIENLKALQRDVETAASDLKKRAEQAALGDVSQGDVMKLQKEAATKITMTQIMTYAIAISVRRSDCILAFLSAVVNELSKASKFKAV